MCAKHYENPTMLSRVTAKNVGDVFFETHCRNEDRLVPRYEPLGPEKDSLHFCFYGERVLHATNLAKLMCVLCFKFSISLYDNAVQILA